MKVQLVTSYRVSHLQRYGVTVRGKVTSAYPPLGIRNGKKLTNTLPAIKHAFKQSIVKLMTLLTLRIK